MRRTVLASIVLALLRFAGPASAQSLDDLNLQVHGYATQAGLYSDKNSWNTTDSSEGSASWSEAVVSMSAQPASKLSFGVQARFFLLGDYGNSITLDWAQGDYRLNERFGLRAGKVKTPVGLLNESQDIDPAQLWVMLPQSIYPIASRNSTLSHYGGVGYGKVSLGESGGKLEYKGFAGQRVLSPGDGYFRPLNDLGITMPNGISGPTYGGSLRWKTPLPGLLVGASESGGSFGGELVYGPYTGFGTIPRFRQTWYFGAYERKRFMLAGEYSRLLVNYTLAFPSAPPASTVSDRRAFYAMASYKPVNKFTAGLYFSSYLDRHAAFTSARYQKDWALAARYDFNPFLYLKVEQHWIDGTAVGFSTADNPNLAPQTRLSLIKVGTSF